MNARVKVAGQGPALVYLHSGYGLIWDDFLDQLARDFTVYAPEHPGTSAGDPDAVKSLDDLWDLVLYYYEMFDKLGLDAPAVVGHSFGGMVAAELAATNPKRVGKLVLIDPLGLWRDDAPIKNYMVAPQGELDPLFFGLTCLLLASVLLTAKTMADDIAAAEDQSSYYFAIAHRYPWLALY